MVLYYLATSMQTALIWNLRWTLSTWITSLALHWYVLQAFLIEHLANLVHHLCFSYTPFLLCLRVVDVGLCFGSSGGSSGLVQVGPESTGHPRLSRPPASLHRPLPWPHEAGGVSGAAPEGGTAAADPVLLTPHIQHVFLPQP